MRVLVACESSGVVRRAFRARGHDAWSCDLLPVDDLSPFHLQQDALSLLDCDWDLMIAHPPCTYLSRAGARWWKDMTRHEKALEAAAFVLKLWNAPIERVAIENPIGKLNQFWRHPDQTINPWQFGHPFSKATCLWLKNLSPLQPTAILTQYTPLLPSNVGHGRRRGQRSSPGVVHTAREASRTFDGIADAMAGQWGSL